MQPYFYSFHDNLFEPPHSVLISELIVMQLLVAVFSVTVETDLQLWPAHNHYRDPHFIFLTGSAGFSLPVLPDAGEGELRSLPHFCFDTAENRSITNQTWQEECKIFAGEKVSKQDLRLTTSSQTHFL